MAEAGIRWPIRALAEVARAGRFPLDDRDFTVAYRSPTHCVHIYDYEGEIRIGDRVYRLRPGDVTVTPARGEIRYHLPERGHHWCVHFHPIAPGRADAIVLPLHCSFGERSRRLVDGVIRIAQLLAQPGSSPDVARMAASACLQELLLRITLLDSPIGHKTARSTLAIERAAAHLDAHFSQPLEVPRLAAMVSLTQNYFARRFFERFGMTAQRYVLARRIEHAEDLLRTTDLPINHIAARVGFGDSQHFNKAFRRATGISPSRARG